MTEHPHPTTITFLQPQDPEVSVLVPVHNRLDLTLDCLAALHRTADLVKLEVIVIDDCSTDDTATVLQHVEGLIIVTTKVRSGFQRAVQAGVDRMKGRYLFMLNNDTEVHPGWLEALLDVAASDEVGAVGCKLVYPDGRLQEAGGIVWNDASAWNWGHGCEPDAPAYSYRREVDYASGAALLVRRDVFDEVGGFDPRFAPAYFEDVDLCFKIRDAGYKIMFQPRSVVTHIGGQSYDSPEAALLKEALMETNRPVFEAKWRARLDQHWANGVGGGFRGGRIDHRPRVLVCDATIPAYDTDAGGLRMTCILEHLVDLGCQVTLLPESGIATQPYTRRFQDHGVEVLYPPLGLDHVVSERAGLYNIVVLSRPQVASVMLDQIRAAFPSAIVVYDTVDIHHRREERRLALEGEQAGPDQDELRRSELRLMRRADVVSTVSEVDAECVRRWVPGARTVVLPTANPMPTEPRPGFAGRSGLVFIGGFQHPPNVDAMLWFVDEVLPLVRAKEPCTLAILGSKPPRAIRELSCEHVTVTGYVPDVDPFFDAASVFVAPLRYGAGIKGKVAHAMSLGLPVVTTTVGTEGMGIVDRVHALVRDSPQAFADAITELGVDEELWTSMSVAGAALVRKTLSTDAMRERLQAFLEDLYGLSWRGTGPGTRVDQGVPARARPVPHPTVVRPASPTEEELEFSCNVCGRHNVVALAMLGREVQSCVGCGSTPRWRSMISSLSLALFGTSLAIDEFPAGPELLGLGTSDWEGYATRLAAKLGYTNTYYDREPRLDLVAPVPDELRGRYDFITSSDVLEHVPPPYATSLAHCRELLKPGGALVLTAPMKREGPTDEHFPDLFDYELLGQGDDQVLRNRTRDGEVQTFTGLVFHGGVGATLEMRLLSVPDVIATLESVGFEDVQLLDAPVPEHGVLWHDPFGWPVIARAAGR